VNNASLWTNIYIQTAVRKPNARLDNFLSILGMQLGRTANLLLDVSWSAWVGDEFFVAALQLIREKASFSRWRTFDLYLSGRLQDDAPWASVDAFTNLEVLFIWRGTDNSILTVIDRMITSHLKVLDINYISLPEKIVTFFAKSLIHISSLRIGKFSHIYDTPFLPANVINLQLETARDHPFPLIRAYELEDCIFNQGHGIDLRSMTALTVTGILEIGFNCHVFLPALRELRLGKLLRMDIGAKIEAPALDHLYFTMYYPLPLNAEAAGLHPGYLLSPSTSIFIGTDLEIRSMIEVLAISSNVTHATLQFNNWADAQVVLERLAGLGSETNSQSVENDALCPRLSELRLDFDWKLSEPSTTKEWLLDALKSRRKAGFMSPLSIYVRWKGEGTYLLLTDNRQNVYLCCDRTISKLGDSHEEKQVWDT